MGDSTDPHDYGSSSRFMKALFKDTTDDSSRPCQDFARTFRDLLDSLSYTESRFVFHILSSIPHPRLCGKFWNPNLITPSISKRCTLLGLPALFEVTPTISFATSMLHTEFVRRYRRVLGAYQESMVAAGLGATATHRDMVADLVKLKGWGKSKEWLEDRLVNGMKSRTPAHGERLERSMSMSVRGEMDDDAPSGTGDTRSEEDDEDDDEEFDPPLIHYLRSAAGSGRGRAVGAEEYHKEHVGDVEGRESPRRRQCLALASLWTWWLPNWILSRFGLTSPVPQDAFREKMSLLLSLLLSAALYLFLSTYSVACSVPLLSSIRRLNWVHIHATMANGSMFKEVIGGDVSGMFWASRKACAGFGVPADWAVALEGIECVRREMRDLRVGFIAQNCDRAHATSATSSTRMLLAWGRCYNLTSYFRGASPTLFFGPSVTSILDSFSGPFRGNDASSALESLMSIPDGGELLSNTQKCLDGVYLAGSVDDRNIFNPDSLHGTPRKRDATNLSNPLQSILRQNHSDERRMVMVVVDGEKKGCDLRSEVVNVFGGDVGGFSAFEMEGVGGRNVGEVMWGFGKTGRKMDDNDFGERGRRDSYVMVLRFLQRVHFNAPMSMMELEMFRYLLLVRPETVVHEDGLRNLMVPMVLDPKVMGVCGNLQATAAKWTFLSMLQMYDFHIQNRISKAFESVFDSVLELSGSFALFRLRSASTDARPLLLAPNILREFSRGDVKTLHMANMIMWSEEMFLTTLLVTQFRDMKTKFASTATATTTLPATLPLFTIRRIHAFNSRLHNLSAIAFSPSSRNGRRIVTRKYVAFTELLCLLFQVLVFPFSVAVVGVLVMERWSFVGIVSGVVVLAPVLAQIVVFLGMGQWRFMGWLAMYILAIPLFTFSFPFYAIWNSDEGLTDNQEITQSEKEDPSPVVLRRLSKTTQPQSTPLFPSPINPDPKPLFTISRGGPPSPRRDRFQATQDDGEILNEIRRLIRTVDLSAVSRKQIRGMLAKQFGEEVEGVGRRNMVDWYIDLV
ncbi:chitin synthase-domain-containing protein [Chytridium lagenaria]|nr:chitin synthase-domain-containing protein [Chytridium lagenaria]